jgi:serine/threonine protein kinase
MIGQFLRQYRIDAQLGAGAMGVVYRAYDTRLQRTVAIKRLQHASPEVSGLRLLEEARAAATLNHPSICTIHEVAEIDGHAFIVMEYVDGRPLCDLISPAGLPVGTVLEYGIHIADAVAFAHAGGIVHRDLKSSNIVITRAGRPKILDFGLARRVAGRSISELSESVATVEATTVDVAGTPQYMSPEALRGESSNARDDVWSLGIVLYEMATGHRPYDERTPFQLAARVLSDAPVDVPPSVAPQLAAVIKRCLTKQPERRYAQAGEVRAALEAVQLSAAGLQPVIVPTRVCSRGARVLACSRPSPRSRCCGQNRALRRAVDRVIPSRRLPLPSATAVGRDFANQTAIRVRSIAQYGALGCPDAVALRWWCRIASRNPPHERPDLTRTMKLCA